jgi:hypothetical protein
VDVFVGRQRLMPGREYPLLTQSGHVITKFSFDLNHIQGSRAQTGPARGYD